MSDLAQAYSDAVYRFTWRGQAVTLRFARADGESAPEPSLELPAGDWAIITACNPGHDRLSETENAERNRRLRTLVESAGLSHAPSEASDEVGGHREPGLFITGLPREDVLALARAFDQHAVVFGQGPVCGLLLTSPERWDVLPARLSVERPA